jgi:hypothetical protein
MLEGIVAEVISRIELPDLELAVSTAITADPYASRNALEIIVDEDQKLKQTAIENLPEDLQKIRDAIVALPRAGGGIGKNQVYNFIREAVVDGTIPAGGGGSTSTFETVSKNLTAVGATLNYTGQNLTSIVYVGGITKTLNYTGDNLTSVVLSGTTPEGIDLTKTLTYTGDNLTGVSYS